MKRHFQCVEQVKSPSKLTKYCACHAKWMSSMICVTYETAFPMRGASEVTLQPHQILRLPRKMNVINDLRHIWNRISNAWSKWSHPPTSPNTAPATQNECHQWSASHMKRHFQCAEQLKSPSNLTKYCACHEILKLKISSETPWSASANRKTIRGYPRIIRRYPRIKSSSRTRRFGDLPDPILETLFYCKIQHFAVLLSPKMSRSAAPVTKSHPQVTRQPQQILRLPHKINVIDHPHHIWNVISNARSKYS